MTTAVVMAVVTMSSRRPNSIITRVPIPISAAMPTDVKGKLQRYARHSAKLTSVALRRAIPADTLWTRVSLNTNVVATTAHIPPRRSEDSLTNHDSAYVEIR